MPFYIIRVISAAAGLCLALSSCGQKNEEERQRFFELKEFSIGDCSQSPFAGEDFVSSKFSNTKKKSTYFDKSFYPRYLEQAIESSSYSIAHRLFKEGVDLYKVPTRQVRNCLYFDFLYPAPKKYHQQWDSIQGSEISGSTLLGLFTTQYERNNDNRRSKLNRPTILLRDSVQKWTLLHELSHYLYAQARVKQHNLSFNRELEDKVKSTRKRIRRLKRQLSRSPKREIARDLAQNYHTYFNLQFELDKRTALEEFAIESHLLQISFESGIPGVNHHKHKKGISSYLRNNSQVVTESYEKFIKELKKTRRMLPHQWLGPRRRVNQLIAKIDSTLFFIEDKIIEAQNIEESHHQTMSHKVSDQQEATKHSHYSVKDFDSRHQSFNSWH